MRVLLDEHLPHRLRQLFAAQLKLSQLPITDCRMSPVSYTSKGNLL